VTTIEVPGATLYVERAGDGPPLLFVSGSGSALADGMGPALLPLNQSFDVIGWDHRGLGQSTSDEPSPTMADYARDGFALADALGLKEFRLVGVSFGGMVAMEMAVTHPERITALGLVCTSAGGAGGASYPLHERPSPESMALLVDTRPGVAAQLMGLLGERPPPAEPGYARQLEARRTHDVWDRLARISCPTLVQGGSYDGIAPPANSEAIASRVVGARLELYEGGHAFLYQDPRAFADLAAFLRGEGEDGA
jgi:pimeloyl-ACP methyl ester carboxylesterase